MNLAEIENNLEVLDLDQGMDLIYDLLRAYGLPRASISKLKSGTYDKSDYDQEVLWKGKVFYRYEPSVADDALYALIEDTRTDDRIERLRPRFLIIRNENRLVARDQVTTDTLDIPLSDLAGRSDFFMPWAGIEKTQIENANVADIKAAEKMARLYDEIVRHNHVESATDRYNLNVFFSRLLFCFFAEDTGVFDRGQFTKRIADLTQDTGEDVAEFLDRLFVVFDTEPSERGELPAYLSDYGYVNGSLFSESIPSPAFTAKARQLIIDCGKLDWAYINPDIFGSMMQAVVHQGERAGLGMHYTSVENIMKVIRPLFLDELEEEFTAAQDDANRLKRLLKRISKIKIFDPACGSGNFLVIAYKELRKLENKILGQILDLKPDEAALFTVSEVKLENFHGIEIDSFAHEIAMLSLWLAKHQMNLEFEQRFGVDLGLIPLKEGGVIVHGNATRLDWEKVTPKSDAGMVFVVGNPPYLGSARQAPEHKLDFENWFGTDRYPRDLDYIALWFFKGAQYISDGRAELAFVSTNSASQGDHVALMWPRLLDLDVEVKFAHQSFLWSNNAKGGAGVTCVVIGLTCHPGSRSLFSNGAKRRVDHISPYLIEAKSDTIIRRRRTSISDLPTMLFGSKPTDGGHLSLSATERADILRENPEAADFIYSYKGAEEFIQGKERYCIWVVRGQAKAAQAIPRLGNRFQAVSAFRLKSRKAATRRLAARGWQFAEPRHQVGSSIIVPAVSSERREYIPMGFLDERTVISNAANAIFNAEPWLFGLVQSRMHMVWVRAVAGRLKSDYRYSAVLVYNTFPVPELDEAVRNDLTEGAFGVLEAREKFSSHTLAQLYDPDKMPPALREAHERLDEIVDRIYRKKPFESDEERLEMLFEMYTEMTTEEDDA